MHKKWQGYGRSVIAVAAGVTLLSGGTALAAQEKAANDKDRGDIRVCKEIRGFDDRDQKFRFVIRQRGEGRIAEFQLRGEDCRVERDLDVGTYRVREREMPRRCELVDINVRGPFERINLRNATAVVKVEEDRTTTVTFVDRCRRHDR